jgi:hypothetical protein
MIVLATISDMDRLGVVLDLDSGALNALSVRREFFDFTIVGRPPCRPFGITWTSTELFIANNRQLLAFDSELRYVRTVSNALQVNSHQIAYQNDRVWVVSPWTNSLIGLSLCAPQEHVELNLLDQTLRAYVPQSSSEDDDLAHFNSLLWANGRLHVAAHGFGRPSFVISHDQKTFQLLGVHCHAGSSIHGLALCDDELFWLSSGTGEIRSNRGTALPLSRTGHARGFAMTQNSFIVAISEFLSRREERCGGDSWIQVIDRHNLHITAEFHLHDTGSINDLRLLDTFDFAHYVDPFWQSQ